MIIYSCLICIHIYSVLTPSHPNHAADHGRSLDTHKTLQDRNSDSQHSFSWTDCIAPVPVTMTAMIITNINTNWTVNSNKPNNTFSTRIMPLNVHNITKDQDYYYYYYCYDYYYF